MQRKNTRRYLIIVCFVLILPVLLYSLLSVPSADDFSNANTVGAALSENGSFLRSAIIKTGESYLGLGGYWFSLFLNYFFCPLLRNGIPGIRLFNCAVLIFFFASLYYLCRCFLKAHFSVSETTVLAVFACTVTCIVNNYKYSEIYAWYTVMVAYILPISVLFLGLACFIQSKDSRKIVYPIAAAVCGVCASGTSLNVAALNCGMYFLLFVVHCCSRLSKKQKIISLVILCAVVLSAVVNLLAPGNFARRGWAVVTLSFRSALFGSIQLAFSRVCYLTTKTAYPAVILVICVFLFPRFDCSRYPTLRFSCPLLVSLLLFFGVVIVDFTVIYGYGTGYFPDRCVFVQDLTIYLLTSVWLIYFMGFCSVRIRLPSYGFHLKAAVAAVCLLFSALTVGLRGEMDLTSVYMIRTLINGQAIEYSDYQEALLYKIQESSEEDVVVQLIDPPQNDILSGVLITQDPSNWVNSSISDFYNKNSVVLIN